MVPKTRWAFFVSTSFSTSIAWCFHGQPRPFKSHRQISVQISATQSLHCQIFCSLVSLVTEWCKWHRVKVRVKVSHNFSLVYPLFRDMSSEPPQARCRDPDMVSCLMLWTREKTKPTLLCYYTIDSKLCVFFLVSSFAGRAGMSHDPWTIMYFKAVKPYHTAACTSLGPPLNELNDCNSKILSNAKRSYLWYYKVDAHDIAWHLGLWSWRTWTVASLRIYHLRFYGQVCWVCHLTEKSEKSTVCYFVCQMFRVSTLTSGHYMLFRVPCSLPPRQAHCSNKFCCFLWSLQVTAIVGSCSIQPQVFSQNCLAVWCSLRVRKVLKLYPRDPSTTFRTLRWSHLNYQFLYLLRKPPFQVRLPWPPSCKKNPLYRSNSPDHLHHLHHLVDLI